MLVKNMFVVPNIEDKNFPFRWKGCEIFLMNITSEYKKLDNFDWCFKREWLGRKIFCLPIGTINNLCADYKIQVYNGDILMLYVENLKHNAYDGDTKTEKQKENKKERIKAYEDKQKAIKDHIWKNLIEQLNYFWKK